MILGQALKNMQNNKTNTQLVFNTIIVFFMIFLCVNLTGCCSKKDGATGGSASGGKTDLVFWNTMSGIEAEAMDKILEQFHKENPDITIKHEIIPFYETRDKFREASNQGRAPDILRADRFWIPSFAAEKLLAEISPEEFGDDYKEMVPVSKELCMWEGKNWAVPISLDTLGLFYNKKHFKEKKLKIPNTFDDFLKAAKTLTDGNGKYGFFIYPNGWYLEPFLFGFGVNYFDKQGNIAIKSDATKRAFDFLLHMKKDLKVVPPVSLSGDHVYSTMVGSFKRGQVSMIMIGPWEIRSILEGSEFRKDNLRLGVAPLPKGPYGSFSPTGCQALVISASSKKKAAAMKFLHFMFSHDIQKQLVMVNYGMPARKSVFSAPELTKDPYIGVFIKQLQMNRKYNFNPLQGDIYEPLNKKLVEVLNGDLQVNYAISDIVKAWEAKHKKNGSGR